ncbi:hypothetical protein [Pseudescherichia sp.]|uniref:hypothetical protein n=1 Tax=Pseudescherichia sp. TaxID=2055881 RepID=UPI0028A00F9C|nr:hypothetical protein [Pseudescherichia sp.]
MLVAPLVLGFASGAMAAAEMDAAGYERVIFSICKDNPHSSDCSKLASQLMLMVKNNGDIAALCDKLDESGGNSATKPSCVNARNIQDYIQKKNESS